MENNTLMLMCTSETVRVISLQGQVHSGQCEAAAGEAGRWRCLAAEPSAGALPGSVRRSMHAARCWSKGEDTFAVPSSSRVMQALPLLLFGHIKTSANVYIHLKECELCCQRMESM